MNSQKWDDKTKHSNRLTIPLPKCRLLLDPRLLPPHWLLANSFMYAVRTYVFTSAWKRWVPLYTYTTFILCAGRPIIWSEMWMISAEIWLQFCFVLSNHLFLRICYNTLGCIDRFASKNIHWPICVKIYNHSVSPNSKKYSQHELKRQSSALTKCIHTWQLLLYTVSMQYY